MPSRVIEAGAVDFGRFLEAGGGGGCKDFDGFERFEGLEGLDRRDEGWV